MRKLISGLVAAVAVMAVSAVPAKACGGGLFGGGFGGGLFGSSCSPCGESYVPCAAPPVYVAPVASGCGGCGGGWGHERLPDPEDDQYYSGGMQQYYRVNQGPTYTGPGNWAPRPVYREGGVSGWGGYHHRPYYGAHRSYYHGPRMGYGYGYGHRHGYAPRYGMHYGAPRYGHYGRPLRRYY